MRRWVVCGLSLLVTLALVMSAPAGSQEIIVTSRQQTRAAGVEEGPVARPAVIFRNRADNVVQQVWVVDDTRNAEARLAELKDAIASLDQAANQSRGVQIALVLENAEGLQLVRPFARDKAIAAIENGSRQDTSRVRVLAKTAITDADRDQAQPIARIEAFLRSVKLSGRAQIERLGEPALSLIRPEQYRGAVAAAIAADARLIAGQLGEGYAAKLEGLERPIEWEQLDELELGLYVRYRLTILR